MSARKARSPESCRDPTQLPPERYRQYVSAITEHRVPPAAAFQWVLSCWREEIKRTTVTKPAAGLFRTKEGA